MNKVLHIANWYPNSANLLEALFVREHFRALDPHAEQNNLVHLQFVASNTLWRRSSSSMEDGSESVIIHTFLAKSWKLNELLTYWILSKILRKKLASTSYDVICFHIAYPLCRYMGRLKREFHVPMCIVEHWTAYHLNFNLPAGAKSLNPIRQIFSHNIPIITVSKALADDINHFSSLDFPSYVVPNVVNDEVFDIVEGAKKEQISFFMVNYWRPIKNPMIIIQAFESLLDRFPGAKLTIGGYGPLYSQMNDYVQSKKLEHAISFLGEMSKEEIAAEMNKATAFVHSSSYETFSVVTAEALMCGTPVVVQDLPAIAEFVDNSNGILVQGYEIKTWVKALEKLISQRDKYDPVAIRTSVKNKFSKKAVGQEFAKVLAEIREGYVRS